MVVGQAGGQRAPCAGVGWFKAVWNSFASKVMEPNPPNPDPGNASPICVDTLKVFPVLPGLQAAPCGRFVFLPPLLG